MVLGTLLIGAGVITLGVCAAPILDGFGIGGVTAGSAAAAAQALIGNVAAGSLFSSVTSLGMTGALAKGALTGGVFLVTGIVIKL